MTVNNIMELSDIQSKLLNNAITLNEIVEAIRAADNENFKDKVLAMFYRHINRNLSKENRNV